MIWLALGLTASSCQLPERRFAVRDGGRANAFETAPPGEAGTADAAVDAGTTTVGEAGEKPTLDGPDYPDSAGLADGRQDAGQAPTKAPSSGGERPALGEPCTGAGDCASGFCVEDVCCDTNCSGSCQTCTGSEKGVCTTVIGPVPGGKDKCAGAGICRGECDGVSAECVYPNEAVTCNEAVCLDDGALISKGRCDRHGNCLAGSILSCGSYVCEAMACRSDCRHDGHCSGSALCVSGQCRNYEDKQILMSRGAFVFEDLTYANVEPCHGAQFLLCVEQ